MRVVVVGSGIAGLTAAVRLAGLIGADRVCLVTKAAADESNTRYAQGGIAAALAHDDSPALHAADTIAVGGGLNEADAVRLVCTEGPGLVRALSERLGVGFDRDRAGEFSRGLEAAHSRARVLHAGGDATGAAIVSALLSAAIVSGVEVRDGERVTDLIVSGGRVAGVALLARDGRSETLRADAVVLATGGIGALYSATTNPVGAIGEGIALAWRAGALLRDLEFVQFHPTSLAVGEHFLISEAVRGEGAVLLDSAGRRFMTAVHPQAELAPRDVVARGIARAMAAQGGAPVLLDATGLGGPRALATRFPTIDARVRSAGFDWARAPIPVSPAAHYSMGGVLTDHEGRTSVLGLYAIGEVASSGLHGANRLASNSLLEGLVFGVRAAEAIAAEPESVRGRPASPDRPGAGQDAAERVIGAEAGPSGTGRLQTDPGTLRARLQSAMWAGAGVERSGEGLARALAELQAIAAAVPAAPRTAAEHELTAMVTVGRLVAVAAFNREESRGAHFRTDHPAAARQARHLVLRNAATAHVAPPAVPATAGA